MATETRMDTAPDGSHVWVLPFVTDGVLLVITSHKTHLIRLPLGDLDRVADEIVVEGVPADMVTQKGLTIPHSSVTFVCGEEKRLKITINYQSKKALVTSHGVAAHEIVLSDLATFTRILESFRAQFGEKVKYKRKAFTASRAVVAPAVLATLIALSAWGFGSGYLDASSPTSGRRRASREIMAKIIAALGPTGVFTVGVVGVMACAYWGYVRAKNPPIYVKIKPG